MANQTADNVLVAYKVESTLNTPPAAGGAQRFRLNASNGLKLSRQMIMPNEIRSDMTTSMARLGPKSVGGSYPADSSLATFDPLFEAVTRGTWVAAVAITQATAGLTSMRTPTTSTIEASAGSWITAGVRVGDVARLASFNTAANNNINLRIVAVTALILTVAGTPLTVDAAFDTTFSLTIAKKVIQPAVPVRRSFTFEEYYADIDLTAQFTGCRVGSMKVTGQPNGMALVEFGIVGMDMVGLASGASPFYTSPTLTTSIGLVMADATLRFGGADVAILSAFELNLDLGMATVPVIGSVTPADVTDSAAKLSGTISGLRQDFTNLNRFTGETELELQVLLVEPEAEPKDFISLYVPRLKFTDIDKNMGGDGAMIETMQWTAGNKEVVTGYDATMLAIATSAP